MRTLIISVNAPSFACLLQLEEDRWLQLADDEFATEVELNEKLEQILQNHSEQKVERIILTDTNCASSWLLPDEELSARALSDNRYREIYLSDRGNYKISYRPSLFEPLLQSYHVPLFVIPLREILLRRGFSMKHLSSKDHLVQIYLNENTCIMLLLHENTILGDVSYSVENQDDVIYYLQLNLKQRGLNYNDIDVVLCGRGTLYKAAEQLLSNYYADLFQSHFSKEQLHYPELKFLGQCV